MMLEFTSRSIEAYRAEAMLSGLHERQKAVSYNEKRDGSVGRFEKSSRGTQVRQQYLKGILGLQHFLKTNEPDATRAINAFGTFAERIEKGSAGFFSTEIRLIYGPGKRSFDMLCADVGNEAIPLHARVSHVRNLAPGLLVCSSGSVSNLMTAAQELRLSTGGVRTHAAKCRETLLDQAILAFVKDRHAIAPNYGGNEIHYVNGYRNYLASAYGVKKHKDPFVPRSLGEGDLLEDCAAYVAERVTPARLVRQMGEMCLGEVLEHLSAYKNRPLSEQEAAACYHHYETTLQAVLEARYGKIECKVLVHECGDDDAGETIYGLIDDSTLLMRVVARNLREAGVIQQFKFPVVAGVRGEAHVIKQIGDDAFYVKSRQLGGSVTYSPLQISDLPVKGSSVAMVRAALAGTHDSPMLKSLDPASVWRMIGGDQALTDRRNEPDWLRALSEPAVQRYRRAAPEHESFLLDRALETVRGYAPADRQAVLVFAIRQQDGVLSGRLVELIDDVDQFDETGNAVLHYAAYYGCMQVFELAASKTRDPEVLNASGRTALMCAAQRGHADAIVALLSRGCAIDAKSPMGSTALVLAAQHGHTDAVAALLEAGARIDEANTEGSTALIFAAHFGYPEVVDLLLKAGARVDKKNLSGGTPLTYAAAAGHTKVITALLNGRADVGEKNAQGATALICAAQNGHADTIKVLAAAKSDLEAQDQAGRTALMRAARHGHVDAVAALLRRFANVDQKTEHGQTALMFASKHGHPDTVVVLLEGGAVIDERTSKSGMSALTLAAQRGDATIVANLLRYGARVNQKNSKGETALMVAALSGHAQVVSVLLRSGASVNEKSRAGCTALTYAAKNGQIQVANTLRAADPPATRRLALWLKNGFIKAVSKVKCNSGLMNGS